MTALLPSAMLMISAGWNIDGSVKVRLKCCIRPAASGYSAYKEKGSTASLTASGTIMAALLLSAALMKGSMRVPATLLALGEPSACSLVCTPV